MELSILRLQRLHVQACEAVIVGQHQRPLTLSTRHDIDIILSLQPE